MYQKYWWLTKTTVSAASDPALADWDRALEILFILFLFGQFGSKLTKMTDCFTR